MFNEFTLEYVPVHVQRDADPQVAQNARHHHNRDAPAQRQRLAGVAEVMRADLGELFAVSDDSLEPPSAVPRHGAHAALKVRHPAFSKRSGT
jgi:hypothetical protein